jgi:hypothetical protein
VERAEPAARVREAAAAPARLLRAAGKGGNGSKPRRAIQSHGGQASGLGGLLRVRRRGEGSFHEGPNALPYTSVIPWPSAGRDEGHEAAEMHQPHLPRDILVELRADARSRVHCSCPPHGAPAPVHALPRVTGPDLRLPARPRERLPSWDASAPFIGDRRVAAAFPTPRRPPAMSAISPSGEATLPSASVDPMISAPRPVGSKRRAPLSPAYCLTSSVPLPEQHRDSGAIAGARALLRHLVSYACPDDLAHYLACGG